MKRKRPPPTRNDPETPGESFAKALSAKEKASFTKKSSNPKDSSIKGTPRIPTTRRPPKAIPRRMQHMKKHMSVWGARWLTAIEPSTTGSEQGELDPSGMYTASISPLPLSRSAPLPLSPVIMTSSSSSPNSHPLSSEFRAVNDPNSPALPFVSHDSPSFDGIYAFDDILNGGDSFTHFPRTDKGPSYRPHAEGQNGFDLNTELFLSHPSQSHSITSNAPSRDASILTFHSSFTPLRAHTNAPSNNLIPLDFVPQQHAPSDFNTLSSYNAAALDNTSFSDWLPPTMQHSLPLDNVAHFLDDFQSTPFDPTFAFVSPSQSSRGFPTAANSWRSPSNHNEQFGQTMPMIASYSTSPIYTGPSSPHLAFAGGSYSPTYRSGSGSPLASYSGHPYPRAPISPLPTRTGSSGSGASLHSLDNRATQMYAHPMISRAMLGGSEYSDDYRSNYPSPHSAVYTNSPSSISSAYGPLDGPSGYPVSNTSRTIPLPFHTSQAPDNSAWSNYPAV
ncbi:hypothetical protein B0H10DRAFT_1953875 [Mycena sp. CBHHK59/15]|nr:hypothetical protein B0H10DRAFT_1953875 [Mycena sp. CBHHK59/15]